MERVSKNQHEAWSLWRWFGIIGAAVVLYVLSIGPAVYLRERGLVSKQVVEAIYTPVIWIWFWFYPETTAFHVSMGYLPSTDPALPARAETSIGLRLVRCFILSNATGRPSYTPEDYYRCSGSHPLSEGEPVAWKCEMKDGYTFTQITIDSTTYDLAKGRLFILSRKAGALKVHQLQTGPTKRTGSGGQELRELEKSHPEIQDLLKQ